jgi:hypothetical protein
MPESMSSLIAEIGAPQGKFFKKLTADKCGRWKASA